MSALPATPRAGTPPRAPIPAVTGGWAPVPWRLLELGPGLSRIERAVVDLILLRTIADDTRGRPEWVGLSEPEFAQFAGATKDGVHHAITRLERMRVIESEAAGRSKRYRLTLDGSADVPTPAPRKVLKKPPQSEHQARAANARARVAAPVQAPAASSIEAAVEHVSDPNGAVVEVPIPAAAKVVTISNATSARLAITAAAGGAALSIAIAEACAPAKPEPRQDQDRGFLLEFVPLLHCAPREADVEALAAAREGVVSIEQLRAYVGRRIGSGLAITGYGIFAKLATDCVAAADRWAAAHAPAQASRAETLGDRMHRWADRLEEVSPDLAPIAAELRALAAEVGAAADPERFAGPLEALHERMLDTARRLAAERVDGFRQQIAAEMQPLRDRMSRAQFADLSERQLERRILNALGLPALDLWSLYNRTEDFCFEFARVRAHHGHKRGRRNADTHEPPTGSATRSPRSTRASRRRTSSPSSSRPSQQPTAWARARSCCGSTTGRGMR